MFKISQISRNVCQKVVEDVRILERQKIWTRFAGSSFPAALAIHPAKRSKSTVARISINEALRRNHLVSDSFCSHRGFASGGDLPAHTSVQLPALSPTMERGSIKSWEKKEGDKLNEGDLLALIETDKATMDFETPEEGYLAKIVVPGGTKDVMLGQTVCIIVPNQADVAAFRDYQVGQSPPTSSAPQKQVVKEVPSTASKSEPLQESRPAKEATYPVHQKILLPALSPTVEKSTIKSWNKKVGDKIGEGDLIAQVETDKATIDWNWENPEEVFVAKLFVPDGTADVPVGKLVAIFVSKKEDVAAFKDFDASSVLPGGVDNKKPPTQAAVQERQVAPQGEQSQPAESRQSAEKLPQPEGGRVFASPFARTLAKEKGLEISSIKGTGPDGRVIAEDVKKFQPVAAAKVEQKTVAKPAPAISVTSDDFVDFPLTNIRQVIAKRLLLSKQTIPHYYLTVEVILDQILQLRQELNTLLEKEKVKISVNDFIIKASALACKRVPQANSSWMDTFIRQYNSVDVNVAVSTDAGLITPIVFGADTKGILEINADVIRLADAARKGKLKPHEFQGGTFTVSNLGMFGIKNFSAVINPPQACILAVGGANKELIVDEKNPAGYRVGQIMSVTLSCDHRVVDGAVGAEWLRQFKRFLERPETMLL